ncbi:glycosyltransferase family protein [Adhaeribacter soli]|uniref:glycosyltransferase family 39 protein n=1 Tax=Adhaeribacter soli TaxID=2607655 RepID=UPI0017870E5D|nr:glycosyltransferase family 39 protein [Adhaeribacter soli]
MQVSAPAFSKVLHKGHWAVATFFGLYLLLGLLIYKDYGISFDEQLSRENGIVNAKYLVEKLAPRVLEGREFCPRCPPLENYSGAVLGPVFETATVALEWVLGLEDQGDIFRLRHLCTFLLFFTATLFFYFLLQERFRNPLISLAGVLMLILSPRIFADSFYNPKDLPFLSLCLISTYTLVRYLKRPGLLTAFWHALACALAMDIRIMGILLPAATLVYVFLHLRYYPKEGISGSKVLVSAFSFLLFFIIFAITFWPHLWEHPFSRFSEAFLFAGNFTWTGHILYLGEYVNAQHLPWHYLPVWLFITTPLLYTFLFLVGIAFIVRQVIASGISLYQTPATRQDLVIAGLFFVPATAAIVLNLVFYDGWRHFYFLYPWFVYLATVGLSELLSLISRVKNERQRLLLRNALAGLWLILIGKVAFWMVLNHPHQQVYFSIFSSDKVRQQFELDYWGLSYREGLEFVVADSKKEQIRLFVPTISGYVNSFMLPPEQRKRLVYVKSIAEADYFLTEYRWHPQDFPLEKEVHQVKADDFKILSVFKLDRVYKEVPVFNPGLP